MRGEKRLPDRERGGRGVVTQVRERTGQPLIPDALAFACCQWLSCHVAVQGRVPLGEGLVRRPAALAAEGGGRTCYLACRRAGGGGAGRRGCMAFGW